MKKLYSILRLIICLLCLICSGVFIFFEAWLMLSGDHTLYESVGFALFQLLAKILIALIALIISLLSIIKKQQSFIFAGIGFLLSSLITLPFTSNGFSWFFVVFSLLFIITDPAIAKKLCKKNN